MIGEFQSGKFPKSLPASIAITDFFSWKKVEGEPRVEIHATNIIIPDNMFNIVIISFPIRGIPADSSMVFTYIHMVSCGPSSRFGDLGIFRIIFCYH
jgi:hypothetical protein